MPKGERMRHTVVHRRPLPPIGGGVGGASVSGVAGNAVGTEVPPPPHGRQPPYHSLVPTGK
jgi:hypothetical protein